MKRFGLPLVLLTCVLALSRCAVVCGAEGAAVEPPAAKTDPKEKPKATGPDEARVQLRALSSEQQQLARSISAKEVRLAQDNEQVRGQLQSVSDKIAELHKQITALRATREDVFKAADPELGQLYERRNAVKDQVAALRAVVSRPGMSGSSAQKRQQLQHQIRLKEMGLRQNEDVQRQLKELGTELKSIQDKVRALNTSGREEVFRGFEPRLVKLYEQRDALQGQLQPAEGGGTLTAEARGALLQQLRQLRGEIRAKESGVQKQNTELGEKLGGITEQVTQLHTQMQMLTTTRRRELFAEADPSLGALYRQLAEVEQEGPGTPAPRRGQLRKP